MSPLYNIFDQLQRVVALLGRCFAKQRFERARNPRAVAAAAAGQLDPKPLFDVVAAWASHLLASLLMLLNKIKLACFAAATGHWTVDALDDMRVVCVERQLSLGAVLEWTGRLLDRFGVLVELGVVSFALVQKVRLGAAWIEAGYQPELARRRLVARVLRASAAAWWTHI